jgi:hypothetical protein
MKTVHQLTETLTWTLDNGTLTIGGTGEMPSYAFDFISLGERPFTPPWYHDDITTINIQNGVATIGDRAFPGCSSLTSINIPNSVTTIGDEAFYDCSSLTSINIPNSVTTIEGGAFRQCTSLTSIIVGSGNTAYASEDGILFNKSKTKIVAYPAGKTGSNYNIPNLVTTIGDRAFDGCSSLTSINIPNAVTTIGDRAFDGCSSLTSITVSNGNTAYASEDGVLFNKSKETIVAYPAGKTGSNYNIPDSVETIGKGAFYKCSSLTSINIPNSVTTIGNGAFWDCTSLTSITIPDLIKTVGNSAFDGCSSLTSITIPNAVTAIGYLAFSRCSSLTSITIPDLVKTIGNSAFARCSSLASVSIGNSVTSIGREAFSGCSSLRNVVVLSTTPPSITSGTTICDCDGAFSIDTFCVPLRYATLTVPKGSKAAYQSAEGWKDFGTIVEATR